LRAYTERKKERKQQNKEMKTNLSFDKQDDTCYKAMDKKELKCWSNPTFLIFLFT
jgi:hypothetical protein